ncbi:MAG TPA: hypothetical protein VJB94_01080 [Candidatus Nanoarchaeia archaeon]|nr:hypothetical protein [Candidatus Nanoarchaeia archaeon]
MAKEKEKSVKTPEIPEDVKKKFDALKSKLESFKKKILDKFDKYIIGIELLPPENPEKLKGQVSEEELEKIKKEINVLVVVDDSDSEKMSKFELKNKLSTIIEKTATEIDPNLKPEIMILTELREVCYDAKYEILDMIALGAPLYDPKDLLAALKVSNVHRTMVLKKFEKYVVSYVAVGSLFRGDAKSHDIDVAIIIDDTDVKKMSRGELRDKLGAIIRSMGYEAASMTQVKKEFHIQVYILTDFWEGLKEANPVFFTFLRDGVPLYDRGVFMPWKLLLEMGRIRPSPEAIDMFMDMGLKLLDRAKGKMLGIVAEDIYYATLNPSQAALMMYGIAPPTPKETVALMNEIFVKKEKLLEKKYVDTLEKIRKYYKDIEHGKVKEVKGQELDNLMKEADAYLKRIEKLFNQIERKSEKHRFDELHNNCIKAVEDVLKLENIKEGNVEKGFKKLVDKGIFPKIYLNSLKEVINAKTKPLNKHEVNKLARENSFFIRALIEHIQKKKAIELERAKIKVKYGEKVGEIYLLDKIAYIIEDLDAEKKSVSKAEILENGGLGKMLESNANELEHALATVKIPKKVFIKEKIFEDLRRLYGKDVEIMIH